MKKLISLLILFPLVAFADDTVVNVVPPEVILQILQVLQAIPYVGPILVMILKWIAIVAPVMTALSVCAQVILALPEIVARYKGSHELAEKIRYWSEKIVYWLSFFSVRNAKK
jgi:hypothetical protein